MSITTRLAAIPLAFAALASSVFAQIEGAPDFIDYQGRVLDSAGEPVAPTQPTHLKMYFKVWDHESSENASHLVWAEEQVVTVYQGEFSVRLGEGHVINGEPRPSLLEAFDGTERFLGVSVAADTVSSPGNEITPRLKFLTAPFAAVAQRAKFAQSGPVGGTFHADSVGVGTDSPGAELHVSEADTSSIARIYATGTGQGSGMVYAGQSVLHGGGFAYDGHGEPDIVGDGDRNTFFRRDNGEDFEVFSYGFSHDDVRFAGGIHTGGNSSVDGRFGVGTTSPTVALQVSSTHDASLSNGSGSVLIGSESGGNMVLDNNEIMARNNGAASGLFLNAQGGLVEMGGEMEVKGEP